MAAGDILKYDGTSIVWTDTTGDLAMTLNNLAAGAGRQGAVKDLGVGTTARTDQYDLRVTIEWDTAPAVGEYVEVWLKTGDSNAYDNDDGTGDIAVSSVDNKVRNLKRIGNVWADEALADIDSSASWRVQISERYVMPILINRSGADNLQATNNVNKVILTPVIYQNQS